MESNHFQTTREGQAVYSPLVLRVYDAWVLGFSNRFLWRCPTAKLEALYDRNVSQRHLDIGVGSGYFLKTARWPGPRPDITLMDLNPNSLRSAAARIADLCPKTVQVDVLSPLPDIGRFDSVGLCYLLHCLPGSILEKAVVLDHIAPLLAPKACVFGATIVQGDAPRSGLAQKLMNFYNKRGIFSNNKDTVEDLHRALDSRFSAVQIEISGCVCMFEASNS